MRSEADRIEDIREAATRAVRFAAGRDRRALDSDDMLLFALVKCVEIIGEAASRLPPDVWARYPGVAWPKVINMRHRLVHAYFDWNRDIVWETVTVSLPELLRQLAPPQASNEESG